MSAISSGFIYVYKDNCLGTSIVDDGDQFNSAYHAHRLIMAMKKPPETIVWLHQATIEEYSVWIAAAAGARAVGLVIVANGYQALAKQCLSIAADVQSRIDACVVGKVFPQTRTALPVRARQLLA